MPCPRVRVRRGRGRVPGERGLWGNKPPWRGGGLPQAVLHLAETDRPGVGTELELDPESLRGELVVALKDVGGQVRTTQMFFAAY